LVIATDIGNPFFATMCRNGASSAIASTSSAYPSANPRSTRAPGANSSSSNSEPFILRREK